MKRCDYCGKQNDETAATCCACGTPLAVAPLPPQDAIVTATVPPVIDLPQLTALRAILIFLLSFIAQTIGAGVVTVIFCVVGALQGTDLQNPDKVAEITSRAQPLAFVVAGLCGIVALLVSSFFLVRRDLTDHSPTGAAWAFGSIRNIWGGLGLGVLTAIIFSAIAVFCSHWIHPKLGPVSTMGVTRGAPQLAYIFLALVLAPGPEELLFRGVLYGGFRRSFGAWKAGALVTVIFVLLHITEWARFLPAVLGIGGLALLTLWLRIRTKAIGPAIAAHIGYNGVVVLNACLYTMLK